MTAVEYTLEDFWIKMNNFYGKFNDERIAVITGWLERKKIKDRKLVDLYSYLTENFKITQYSPRPNLPDIAAAVSQMPDMSVDEADLQLEYKGIIDRCRAIRAKLVKDSDIWNNLPLADREFLHKWEDLERLAWAADEKEMPADDKFQLLMEVKWAIMRGFKLDNFYFAVFNKVFVPYKKLTRRMILTDEADFGGEDS